MVNLQIHTYQYTLWRLWWKVPEPRNVFRAILATTSSLKSDLFLAVTGLTVKDFHLLVQLKVFNTEQMNQAVFALHILLA